MILSVSYIDDVWGRTDKQEILWHTFCLISLDVLQIRYIKLQSENRDITSRKMREKHNLTKVEIQIKLKVNWIEYMLLSNQTHSEAECDRSH